jgi:hypothetical protein
MKRPKLTPAEAMPKWHGWRKQGACHKLLGTTDAATSQLATLKLEKAFGAGLMVTQAPLFAIVTIQ